MERNNENEQVRGVVEEVQDVLSEMSRLYDLLAQRGTYNPRSYWQTVLHVLCALVNGIKLRMHDDAEYIEATNRYNLRRAFRIQCRLEDVEDYLLVLIGEQIEDDEEGMDMTEDEDADDDEVEVEAMDENPIDEDHNAGGCNEDEDPKEDVE